MEELQAGGASNSKSFQHFKTQIDKLTKSMTQLEKDTANWRQKYEVSGCGNRCFFTIFFLHSEIFRGVVTSVKYSELFLFLV